jgi:hypothetical protein
MNSNNLRNNLESIKNDVNTLFKKLDDPNEKLFKHTMNTDIRLNGYQDPSSLYRNQLPNETPRVQKEIKTINDQNLRLGVPQNIIRPLTQDNPVYEFDNRKQLYPSSEIKQYNNLSQAYIENENRQPYLSASLRDTQMVEDVLLNQDELKNNTDT